VGLAVLTVGAGAAAAVGRLGGDGAGPPAADLPAATAPVTRQTLVDAREIEGELGYGPATTAVSRMAGTVTAVAEAGTVVRRGQALYHLDDDPVVVLYGDLPAYRTLAPGSEGADVRQLERNLRELGHRGFTVDKEFTWSTAAAVREWQEDLGLPETGRVDLGRVVVAPGAIRVEGTAVAAGDPVGPGTAVLTWTGTARLVVADLEVADRRLAKKGARVTVEMPDGARLAGRIDRVYSVIEPGTDQDAASETKIETVVALTDDGADELDEASVTVRFTADERADVLTVPVAALVALAEGGYGVEVVDGGTSRYVRVDTGLFADGRVEISGDDITEGMTVGMPS
jgi:peptidoglycan hydrolase-like protein with peptidoglycan-binding domain